jgi:hypothetical protein
MKRKDKQDKYNERNQASNEQKIGDNEKEKYELNDIRLNRKNPKRTIIYIVK